MFLVHSPYPWMSPEAYGGAYARAISGISGMVAPVFMFLAGVSVAVIARVAGEEGRRRARARVALRGLEILAIAYLLQAVFWGLGGFSAAWTRVLKVDILNCIGVSMMLGAAVAWPGRRFNWGGLIGFAVLLLGAQVLWRMPAVESLPDGIPGYLVFIRKRSQFPLFPYGAWVFLGLIVGPLWHRLALTEGRERTFWTGAAAFGLASLMLGLAMKAFPVEPDWTAIGLEGGAIRTTVGHFFYKMGILIALLVGSRLTASLLDRFPTPVLVLWGRTSLFAYCAHLIMVYYVFGPVFDKGLSRVGHLAGAAALSVAMYFLCRLWARWAPSSLSAVVFGKH
jgi:uncharacterized membrane protein